MRKKIRNLVVDEISYIWTVQEKGWPEAYLKIWFDGHKTKPWLIVEFPMIESVTPSLVASIIRQATGQKDKIQPVESNNSNCKYEKNSLSPKLGL